MPRGRLRLPFPASDRAFRAPQGLWHWAVRSAAADIGSRNMGFERVNLNRARVAGDPFLWDAVVGFVNRQENVVALLLGYGKTLGA